MNLGDGDLILPNGHKIPVKNLVLTYGGPEVNPYEEPFEFMFHREIELDDYHEGYQMYKKYLQSCNGKPLTFGGSDYPPYTLLVSEVTLFDKSIVVGISYRASAWILLTKDRKKFMEVYDNNNLSIFFGPRSKRYVE